ncbi:MULTISPECIES: penicillin-binding protein activator LpoB [unclassified Brenneria]|uniref:penicillin-binding protein activator LpoB n=1 Tax=unclassified Brenneria TaxID=2634434 RepID=UPI001556DC9D|nr:MULTISPECIES: penicillin-binding protein activator LpoB [unclassified Brenneria]MBJ7221109.1 penicillin-binding protein activator LpoB [Brenneria sp. L3-3C-1]MEE3642350.1 penicillin-binding protein activator LpoB [Brenneria sp. L3_3C_1]MEE3650279.1 penicillin-binding protein activator LpoB [Brenneria sp. HEZEL_4_2_4]NPD00235.1 penicillin-binding protein activator LpoB [Brenneria sp. hezel4-2-4]
MKKYLWVVLATLVLTGCPSRPPEPTEPPATIEPAEPQVPTTPPPGEPVPPPPKIQTLNWDATINPLVAQMLQADGVTPGSILLLDSVKNNTNGALQTAKANNALYNALSNGKAFTLVPREQMAAAKQTLGLSVDDSLGSRSKAIGLARYVSAQYVLYSDVSGDVKSPVLDMQLMLVQTGEIVWSGNGAVQH